MTTDTQDLANELETESVGNRVSNHSARKAAALLRQQEDKLAALQEENERLNCNATVLQEMHDEDIKEINKHKLHIKHIGNDALRTENAELRARLAAMKKQEPIGIICGKRIEPNGTSEFFGFYFDKGYNPTLKEKIYASAGASPVEPIQAQCQACGSDCNERDELIKAEREIERLNAQPSQAGEPCEWTLDDDESGTWASSCGELWSFIDGGPAENRVTYCHHCGKRAAINAKEQS